VLAGFSARGDRLTWDVVMAARPDRAAGGPRSSVEELHNADPSFWARHRETLAGFGVEGAAADQLELLERDLAGGAGKRWFGVHRADELVALGSLLVLDGVGYVDGVFTFPQARGRGHAGALVRTMVGEARRAGAADVLLLVADGGPTGLYERAGFEVVGRIAGTLRRR
jgi:ribosomal protein S18 acetylase RimI-like enzyme